MQCGGFSYLHYFDVLELARDHQYDIVPIMAYPSLRSKKFILLRHDVDVSLQDALRLAELENKHGIRSTYYILLHSPYYNALSPESTRIIRAIAELNHEIGLHYDTTFIQTYFRLESEAAILSGIAGRPIVSIAQHDPAVTLSLKAEIERESAFLDAASIKVMYISDSVQNWRQGCMCGHIGKEDKLQILTHPIWWTEKNMSRQEIMMQFRDSFVMMLDKQLKATYNAHTQYFANLKKG